MQRKLDGAIVLSVEYSIAKTNIFPCLALLLALALAIAFILARRLALARFWSLKKIYENLISERLD